MLHYSNIAVASLTINLAISRHVEVTNRLRTLSRGNSMNQFTIFNTHTVVYGKDLSFSKERHAM